MKRKLAVGLVAIVALVAALVANPSKSASKAEKEPTVVLSSENSVVLNSEVNASSVAEVLLKLKELDKGNITDKLTGKNKKPIYLFLDTPGGSIQAGLELMDAVKGIKRPVHTISLFSASMGFQIAQGLGERLIVKNGVLMSHRARGGFEGEFGGQAPSQIDSRYRLWLDRLNDMDQQTVDRSGGKQTLASYQSAYASELWVTGTKAVEQGYADRIANVSCDDSLNGTDKKVAVFFGMRINYEISKCPMITGPMNISMSLKTNKGEMSGETFLKSGGQFGPYCMQNPDKDKLCALNTDLSPEKLIDVRTKFRSDYEEKKNKVIYMYVGK